MNVTGECVGIPLYVCTYIHERIIIGTLICSAFKYVYIVSTNVEISRYIGTHY